MARYTVPAHLALPPLLWLLSVIDLGVAWGLLAVIHLVFPVVLLATWRWWRGHGDALVGLLLVNHAASFASGGLLMALVPGGI